MFENLDDPVPPSPAPIDGVVDRGRSMRIRRRMIAGAVAAFILAGTIATAAALQGGTHDKVVVSTDPSTTTVSDTTVPDTTTTDTTDTTVPAPTTTDTLPAPPTTVAAPVVTTTTQPHDVHDYSMIRIDYGTNIVGFPAGTTQLVTYTVTNWGSWDVQIGECVGYTADVWASPATSGWPPYTEGIWPSPYPAKGAGADLCADVVRLLPPGGSYTESDTILAGYHDAAGNVMPSPPGFTSFQPFGLQQCSQPCDPHAPNSLAVTVEAPTWPPPPSLYTIDVKTLHPQAASGQSAPVEMTYTNGLAFTVRVPLYGPCWKVKSGTATVDCSGKLPAIVIGPHQSVDLVGTLWARDGFTATGAPLPPRIYTVDLGDLQGTIFAPGTPYPDLTVT